MTFGSLVAAVLAALASACGGATTTTISEITGPDTVRCQTAVATNPPTFPHTGSRATLTVVSERECSWTAASEASWAQVSPASGQGESPLTVTVNANPDAQTRTTALVINHTRLSLTQEPAPCRFELGRTQERMSHEGGRTNVQVTAPGACAWRASSNESWIQVSPQNGSGTGTVEILVTANAAGHRTATITIAEQAFTLVQEARPPTPSPSPGPSPGPPPDPTCSIAIDSAERSFGADGGDGSFRVIAPPGCAWRASSSVSWIDISGSSGTGNDTVRYQVAANTTTSARSGSITVGGQAHTVRQEGAPAGGGGGGGGGEERIELSGRAFLVDGSCPSLSFLVDFRRVFTTGDTRFRGGNCGDVRSGVEVRVEGRVQPDGRVRATDVRIRDDD